MADTAHAVVARKAFPCQGYRCDNQIQRGDTYVRHVAFPGDDVNQSDRPWVLRICPDCQAPKPMPTRRLRKRPTG